MKVTSSNTVEIEGAELVEALEMYGESKGIDLTGIENTKPEPKSLAEHDTRTPEEKARAEASFWKTIAGVVVFLAAVIIGWKTGISK